MSSLRQQVDRIDLRILNLLAQRTKLSTRIGQAKRRHGGCIYVPEREQALLEKVSRHAGRRLPAGAAAAIFREIMSSSRAAQGQGPVGVLAATADEVLSPARWSLGACDRFELRAKAADLFRDLDAGKLALVLLPGANLLAGWSGGLRKLADRVQVAADFPGSARAGARDRIFILAPRPAQIAARPNRHAFLIECKTSAVQLEKKLSRMSLRPSIPPLVLSRDGQALVLLSLATPMAWSTLEGRLRQVLPGIKPALLGSYLGGYGG